MIKATEDHYGFPVDIEWAFEAGRLYLLQARPITTWFPLYPEMITAPGERKKLYMDMFAVTQGFSERLSILGADIWTIVLERLKRGGLPAGPDGYILNLHGRQYFQLHNMMKGLGKRAFGLATAYDNALRRPRRGNTARVYRARVVAAGETGAPRADIDGAARCCPT